MLRAVFSDIHGHSRRLEHTLNTISRLPIDETVCLGDVIDVRSARKGDCDQLALACVAAIPDGLEELLRESRVIIGNQEEKLIALIAPEHYPPELARLVAMPLQISSGAALYLHGHRHVWAERTDEVRFPIPELHSPSMLFHGHRHRRQILRARGTTLEPRDFEEVGFVCGRPIRLEAGFRYLIDPGPVFVDSGFLLFDDVDHTITFMQAERRP